MTFPTTSPGRYDKQQAKVRRSLPSCRGAHIHTTSIKHLFFQACRDGYQRLLFQSSRPSRLLLSRCPSSVSNSMYHSMSHLQRAPRRTHSIPCLLCHTILGKSTLPATSRPLWPRGRRFLMQQQHFRLTFLSLLALGCILLLSMLRPRITFPAIMLCKCMLSILRYDSSHCDSLLPLYLTLAFPPSLSLAVSLVCSFAPSLVTPTPKKHSCSCKGKSLGLLCKNFIQTYNTSQVAISIDDAARALGVERRRIYDIINIFESLDIVARKCKNTYNWLGISNLPQVFGRLQEEAFKEFAQDAVDHGLVQTSAEKIPDRVPPQKKSLGRLSQQFLQLFLAGHPVMALTDASDKILGESTVEDLAAVRVYICIGHAHCCLDISLSHILSLDFHRNKPTDAKANPSSGNSWFESQGSSSLRHCQRFCVPGRLPSVETFVILFPFGHSLSRNHLVFWIRIWTHCKTRVFFAQGQADLSVDLLQIHPRNS